MLVRLGALYVDAVTDDTSVDRLRILNRDPAADETGVPTTALIRLLVVDTGPALAATTRVRITAGGVDVLAFDQARAPQFDAAYAAGSAFVTSNSPGDVGDPDQHLITLVRVAPWISSELVTVRVEAATLDGAATATFLYSFTVQDIIAPTLTRAEARGSRNVRYTFNEPVVRGGGGNGDALILRDVSGGLDFTAPATIRAPGGNFAAGDVGLYLSVLGAEEVRNDGRRTIATVIDAATITTTGAAIFAELDSPCRAFVSALALGANETDPARPIFVPLPQRMVATVQADLPTEDARRVVDVEFLDDLTARGSYLGAVARVADLLGNVGTNLSAAFTALPLGTVETRRPSVDVQLLGDLDYLYERALPLKNRREDGTRDLLRFTRCIGETAGQLADSTGRFNEILDPDLVPESLLNALLWHLGVPFSFAFDLAAIDRRRLIDVLVRIYQRNGFERGIEDTLAFFFGAGFDVVPYNDPTAGWELDVDALDLDAVLGVDTQFRLYAFDVVSPIVLTEAQRRRLVEIVDYMRPAHTHFLRLLEPGGPALPPVVTWMLDISALDSTTVLGL